MKIIKGSKLTEITENEYLALIEKYDKVHVDIGTGDGRFVYKNAVENPNTFYVGLDPAQPQLEVYSKKAEKEKVSNVLFVVGSLEMMPYEIFGSAHILTVILPWGTLLQAISEPNSKVNVFRNILRPYGRLELIFGYSQEAEPTEIERLGLSNLTPFHVANKIIPFFSQHKYQLLESDTLTKEQLRDFESTWCKKLSFGSDRAIFHIAFQKLD